MADDIAVAEDERFVEILALYMEAWESGRDAPADTPADAALFTLQLAEQRQFFDRVHRLVSPNTKIAHEVAAFPEAIGKFQIRRKLGQGGFGVVFLAHDPILKRDVALKVPRAEALLTPELRQRFLREARAASSLDHPHLVPVYEAGESGALCWIASAFIDGPALPQWLGKQAKPLSIKSAIEIMIQLAEGLQHAHDRGVLHCDVKPGNVLLVDGESTHARVVAKLTDFGLARFIDADDDLTRTGQFLGTPRYMAPEQARGDRKELSARTDIWALGVILYELLGGDPPFEGTGASLLKAVETADVPSLRARRRDVSRDLEAVCFKCLAKEPSGRYASAGELAADLRRVLAGEPTLARPAPRWRAPIRRARRQLPAAAVMILVLATAGLAIMLARRPDRLNDASARNPRAKVANTVYVQNMRDAAAAWTTKGQEENAWLPLVNHRLNEDMEDVRGFEWYYLWHQASRNRLVNNGVPQRLGRNVVVTSDGRYCLAFGDDRIVRKWDIATGRPLPVPKAPIGELLGTAAFSDDGEWLTVYDALRKRLYLWQGETGKVVNELAILGRINSLAISPDGRIVAFAVNVKDAAGERTELRLWDAEAAETKLIWTGLPLRWSALSMDGRVLIAAGALMEKADQFDNLLLTFELGAQTTQTLRVETMLDVYFSAAKILPDRQAIIAGDNAGRIFRITLPDANGWRGHAPKAKGFIVRIIQSPDQKRLATLTYPNGTGAEGDFRTTISIWDPLTCKTDKSPWAPEHTVDDMAYSPDSRGLIVGSEQGLRFLAVDEIPESQTTQNIGLSEAWTVAYSPDGARMAVAGEGPKKSMKLLDRVNGTVHADPQTNDTLIPCLAWSPNSDYFVTGTYELSAGDRPNNNVHVWNADGTPRFTLPGHQREVRCVAVSPDGKIIASGGKDNLIRVWSSESGETIGEPLVGHTGQINALSFINDATRLISAGDDGRLFERDWQTGSRSLIGESPGLNCMALSPISETIVTDDGNGAVRFWRKEKGEWVSKLSSRIGSQVCALAFSPDGRTLAVAGRDNRIRLLQASTGLGLLQLNPVPSQIHSLSFSPDGERLSAALHDGTVRTWYAPKVKSTSPFLQ